MACNCMGPQGNEPLCPCQMGALRNRADEIAKLPYALLAKDGTGGWYRTERQQDQAWIEANRADNERKANQWPRNLPAWKAQEPNGFALEFEPLELPEIKPLSGLTFPNNGWPMGR